MLTHQLYNKYHKCEQTNLPVLHTHIHNVGYEECGETYFSCPLQLTIGLLLEREMSLFAFFFQGPPSSMFMFICFIDEFPFSSELTNHIAAICLSRPILFTHNFTLLSVQETDLNGWHQWPPLPFGSLLSRPVGSSREEGREESEVKGMYLWFLSLGSFRPSWVPQQLKATADFLATLSLQVFSL